jgi:hypothetical protein
MAGRIDALRKARQPIGGDHPTALKANQHVILHSMDTRAGTIAAWPTQI